MQTNIPQKLESFGWGKVHSFHPRSVHQMKAFTAHLDCDAVLRLKAAVDEAAATLNRNNRATSEGKRAGMWLAFFPETKEMRFTVGRTTLSKKTNEVKEAIEESLQV